MARIRNSFVPNRFGGGYEKLITTDSGSYTLRNTFVPNRFGGGYEQELVPSSDAYDEVVMIPESKEEALIWLRLLIWCASILVGVVSILMNWMDGWKCVPLWWSTGISAVVYMLSYISTFIRNNEKCTGGEYE